MTFGVQSIPRGRDVREAFPVVGACTQDYTLQSTVDVEPIPGMSAILEPHCAYTIMAYLSYSSAAAADISMRLDAPVLSIGQWGVHGLAYAASTVELGQMTGQTVSWNQSGAPTLQFSVAGIGTGFPVWATLAGFCQTAAAGGALQLTAAQLVSTASLTTVHAGSWLEVAKIGETT